MGLSAMMYAIEKKVTNPPRISRDTVEPREEILKKRSIPVGAGVVEATAVEAERGDFCTMCPD
jgi:hypothetical protein